MENNQKNEISLGTTLYDMNKQIMQKQKALTDKEIDKAKEELETWFNWYLDGYAMLLCRERYDFTVFHLYQKANPNPPKIAAQELIELLKERGTIFAIDREVDDNRWEIWIKIDKEVFAYYLFPCDDWVIEC